MTLTAKKQDQKKLATTIGVVILLAVAMLTYIYRDNLLHWTAAKDTTGEGNEINYRPATAEQQQAGVASKTGSTDTPPAPTTNQGSAIKNVQVTITAANQNGPTLQIRTLISAVENNGTCTLVLSHNGQNSVMKTANTQALSSASTCQGFDIPVTELSTGTWQATINYESSTLKGGATKNITIQ